MNESNGAPEELRQPATLSKPASVFIFILSQDLFTEVRCDALGTYTSKRRLIKDPICRSLSVNVRPLTAGDRRNKIFVVVLAWK